MIDKSDLKAVVRGFMEDYYSAEMTALYKSKVELKTNTGNIILDLMKRIQKETERVCEQAMSEFMDSYESSENK
jgi:hypothetical protein